MYSNYVYNAKPSEVGSLLGLHLQPRVHGQ